MRAVISITDDDRYLFFLPIVCYCWDKLDVGVTCFYPARMGTKYETLSDKFKTVIRANRADLALEPFICPIEKEITYAQCNRLFASSLCKDEEMLITSDVDMAVFEIPPHYGKITIFGHDLVPPQQYPICYASGTAEYWKVAFGDLPYQQQLDKLLGSIECENMRGNYWAADQEHLFNKTAGMALCVNRARPGTQFASRRVDRDDANWRSYLGPDLFDAHLWRPGYTDENFANILELLQFQYPNDNFQWLIDYRNKYIKLL
jgi:hypothetical protein